MRYIRWTLAAIVIIFLAALYVDLPQTSQVFGHGVQVNKGLDLAGGVRLLLCADKGTNPTNDEMNTARDIINQRAAGGFGVTEPQVSRVGTNCISVEKPGVEKQTDFINSIGKTGFLALTDSGTQYLSQGIKVRLVCKSKGCAGPKVPVGQTNTSANPPVLQII